MAKFENMTLSYTQIASIPFKTRRTASGSLLDALSRDLTPGQRAAMFPSYVNEVYASASYGAREDSRTPPDGGSVTPDVPATVTPQGTSRKQPRAVTKVPDIIPAGLIPGPDGKPMRVPDQKVSVSRSGGFKNKEEMEEYIREAAKKRGIDPEAAIAVYKSEGANGQGPSLQSTVKRDGKGSLGGYEDSHGPFQLYRGGGMGNDFEERTGLKVDDPTTFRQQIDFALDWAASNGWSKWNGAKTIFSDMRTGIGPDAKPLGVSEYLPEEGEISEFTANETVYDLTQEEIDTSAATAEPIKTDVSGADSIVPLGGDTDAVINPKLRVEQAQKYEARTRKGALAPELENLLGYTAQVTSEATGKNLKFRVTSGGQRMEGAPGATGTHQHDSGYAADFDVYEVMPDGRERLLKHKNPEDAKLIGEATYQFAKAGGTAAGSQYGDMGPSKIHFGIPDYEYGAKAYAGSEEFRSQYNRGRREFETWAKENNMDPTDRRIHVEYINREKAKREELYKSAAVNTAPEPIPTEEETATPTASREVQLVKEATQQMREERASETVAAEEVPKKPKSPTLQEMMGTGYSAAAGGAEITDPSMIVSEDGKKVTRVAETGPEKISVMPRHKAMDVFQDQQTMSQSFQEEQKREEMSRPDIADVKTSNQMPSNFGRVVGSTVPTQVTPISMDMPRISLSAGKAFADAKMVSRFNKADVEGDMGIVYIDRGYV